MPALARYAGLAASVLLLSSSLHAQKVFFEDFEGLDLGPNVDEGLAGAEVWTSTPPTGWTWDASQMPGVGDPANDGVTEWAGWGFADKVWWMTTAGDQRRTEFTFASGGVAIADPDEWDDANHAPGLFNAYMGTPAIDLTGQDANSLVLAFASSWRPEAVDDGAPDFPVDGNGDPINNQTAVITASYGGGAPAEVLRWDSISGSPTFHDHNPNEIVVVPLNNPATGSLTLSFGLEEAANDWWWAVDNIAVGVPPFALGVTGNGYAFTIRIIEALGFTVNQGSIAVQMDGTPVSPLNITTATGAVLVEYDQFPEVFTPGQTYVITVSFTTSDGRNVTDTVEFTAPSFTRVTSTPTTVTAVITDTDYGLAVNETAGIQLSLDGNTVTPGSVTRAGTALTIFYSQAPTLFPSASPHTLAVTFETLDGVSVTDTVAFTSPPWSTIPPALGTAPGTGAESGMRWRTHQLATSRGASIAEAEAQLAGTLGASIHDPNGFITPQGTDGYFRIDWVNWEQAGNAAGRFNSGGAGPLAVADDLFPGSVNADPDYLAGDTRTFLDLAAGFYTMVVNSDDGFQVSVGNATNPTYQVLGSFDAGRGASDTLFYFNVEQAGVYHFRLLWFEGSGGASAEWFTINPDGTAALVGGQQTGAVSAYRTRTVAEPELPSSEPAEFTSIVKNTDGTITVTWTGAGVLEAAPSVSGPWDEVTGATSPYTFTPELDTLFGRIRTD